MKSTLAKQSKENASIKTENSVIKAKLASLEKAQAEQQKLLVKLAAYVQNGKNNAPVQKVNVVQH
jgi:septal ring factor EnvC (AmiA/AmiB activator)